VKVKVEGLADLDRALSELPKATARNVLVRVGKAALEPMAETARTLAPKYHRDLADSIAVSTRLGRYARWKGGRKQDFVEVYMGPGGRETGGAPPQGVQQEFGNVNHPPQPFMRPAWEGEKEGALEIVKNQLGDEIQAAAERAARRAAKRAAKGGS
jgi:HK97 gp10 family phage protein